MPAFDFWSVQLIYSEIKKRDFPAKLELFWELILKVRLYILEGSDVEADARNMEKLNTVNNVIIHSKYFLDSDWLKAHA